MRNPTSSATPRLLLPAALALLMTLALATPTALAAAGAGCANEQLRAESKIDPATGQPYSQGLPECRAYEMVSPPEKNQSNVEGDRGLPVAPGGEAVEFSSANAFGDAEGYKVGAVGEAQNGYVSRRAASGWVTSSVLPPAGVIGVPDFQDGINGDASPDLLAHSSCGDEAATNATTGVNAVCALREADGSWLATAFPSTTGVIEGSQREGDNHGGVIEYMGSSSNLSHVVFESDGDAQEGAQFLPDDTSTGPDRGDALFEVAGLGSAAPRLSLVDVNSSGNEIGPSVATRIGGIGTRTGLGPTEEGGRPASCENIGGNIFSSDYQAISTSGQTIYFTACPSNTEGGETEIYARVEGSTANAHTVAISNPGETGVEGVSECTTCSKTPESAAFEGASADGSKVFFETTQQLLNSDTDSTMDLYEYDFERPEGERLVQLSYGSGEAGTTKGHGAEVQGVLRTSSDGSRVYFVARGVLTSQPELSLESGHQVAVAGADNLYAVNTETGETKFVSDLCSDAKESGTVQDSECPATLNGMSGFGTNDKALWGADVERRAQTTPDGQYLIFTTYARLITSGSEAVTNEAQQVYRYDFQTGRLIRVSIGEPSFPASHNGNTPGMNATIEPLPDVNPAGTGGDGALADINDYARAISENGATIVFATPQALQANDTNTGANPSCSASRGATGCDVYVWHECEAGTCEDGMAGEVHMITPGDDPTSAETGDGKATVSASGSDIFFLTSQPLVGQDNDPLTDVYDARIDGGFPAPTPETASCFGEACQGESLAPPATETPGTASLTGVGNLAPGSIASPTTSKPKAKVKTLTRAQKLAKALNSCHKDKSKAKRKSCEKLAHKRYDPPRKDNRTTEERNH